MIVFIVLIILLILTYVLLAPKNIVVWCFALYSIGLTIVMCAIIFFVFSLSNYSYSSALDYTFYLCMQNFKLALSDIRIMFVSGMTLLLSSNIIMTVILSSNKKKFLSILLLLPIILYIVLNLPIVNNIIYIELYRTTNPQTAYLLSNINQLTHTYNKVLILIYHIIPLLTIIKGYLSTKIIYKRQSMIIMLICIMLLYANIVYLIVSDAGIYFDLDLLNFPVATRYTTLHIISPMLFLFIITLIFGMFTYFRSFSYFTVVSRKMRHLNSRISVKNLQMFIHMQKNLFLIISKYSSISREMLDKEPEKVFSHIETVHKLANTTLSNLSRSLNLLKYTDPTITKQSICDLIDNALAQVYVPSKITINKSYPDEELICTIDTAAVTECFVNIIINAIEAIEVKNDKTAGQIDIVVNFEHELICIDITDNGCGISKKDLKHVFKPLFSSKSTHKNYGLGLSYVDGVITSHNGHINIQSTEGKSTTVQITLPRHYEGRFMLWRK